ncbi:amidohydrolase family protein [Nonomuraea gerenzanensis]|uniref:Nodulin / glutamate-ammonia ligase-like protein n=1 Tax=Nonomuraea gerenzanensis TaxID=93944 RepID=A0A1M4E9A5_9ACTN|nr:amidohydrolase family protein [Nonomuraea gerenzanensis]UBU17730.1 amidohydrolase family protein [Nonomuraea gerenzanensis]SBO95507.1 nodulin / glutamate-ammonia ligase-like protein [Nonomuraea gerenzanensis]
MLPVDLPGTVRDALLAPLVDHHCHGVRRDDLSRAQFELLSGEGGSPSPPGTTHFDTPFGVAVRRWCAPLLDLEPHAPPAVYLARRTELGAGEVNRRLLAGAGVVAFLVDASPDACADTHADTHADSHAGFGADLDVLTAAEMGRHGGAAADELVRIERIERDVAATAELAVDYLDNLSDELAARAARAVGLKTVIGARCGLDFDPARPSRGAVIAAANRRLADPKQPLTDHVLLRYLLWSAVDVARERGLPVQFHTGFGGQAGEPHRADPARLSTFAAALQPLGVPVILLHCYPYHRQAAHLAGVFPHVYVDVGLALPHGTAAAARIMDELLELAPFHKQLFSSGCRGLAETGYLGALTYRRALAAALAARISAGEWSTADAARIAHMIGSGNARRVYRL